MNNCQKKKTKARGSEEQAARVRQIDKEREREGVQTEAKPPNVDRIWNVSFGLYTLQPFKVINIGYTKLVQMYIRGRRRRGRHW